MKEYEGRIKLELTASAGVSQHMRDVLQRRPKSMRTLASGVGLGSESSTI